MTARLDAHRITGLSTFLHALGCAVFGTVGRTLCFAAWMVVCAPLVKTDGLSVAVRFIARRRSSAVVDDVAQVTALRAVMTTRTVVRGVGSFSGWYLLLERRAS